MKPRINMLALRLTTQEKQFLQNLTQDPRFYGQSYLTLQILYTRGIKTPEEMYLFLHGNIHDLSVSYKMKDADKFCAIVKEAILNNEDIIIYTDYDMDGIGSGAVAVKLLRRYAELMHSTSKIYWYANSRFIEGYGITAAGVEDLYEKFPSAKLIITTDNGIVGYAGVQKAKDLGLKIIVTDHHQEGATPVNADAIIDPHQHDDESDFKDLCGAGVIFKLLYMLFYLEEFDEEEVYKYIDIVALSTVADLVPLVGDNRIIVKEGLKRVNREDNPMFKVLRETFNELTSSESAMIRVVDEETFGFTYGPAFNALSRIFGTIDIAMDLLFETDEEKMKQLATTIFKNNANRKEITQKADERAYNYITSTYKDESQYPNIIIFRDDETSEGIIGLVAGYIKETFHRPAIVLTKVEIMDRFGNIKGEKLKGSARSIDNFNIMESFNAVADTMIGFGGHTAAAGLNVAIDKYDEFFKAETEYCQTHITQNMLVPIIDVDTAFKVEEITEENIDALEAAKPYGMKFPKPKVGISNFVVNKNKYKIPDWESPFCGADKMTVRLVDTSGISAVMFKHRERFEKILGEYPDVDTIDEIPVKFIGNPRLSYNSFTGTYRPDFLIESNYLFDVNFN